MKQNLKIKVCGIKSASNREALEKLQVDFIGFIFYPKSKRFVGDVNETGLFNTSKIKVAVFVDENLFEVLGLAKNFGFKYIQLHGKENPETCRILRKQGLKVIKAFNLEENFDFSSLDAWKKNVDYFLFDTKSTLHGGSGKKFNWEILKKYSGENHFFLSGGIKPDDVELIRQLNHPKLFGIDLNSGFEDEPGIKNIEKLKKFIMQLKAEY